MTARKLAKFACKKCDYETNSKDAFKAHAKISHEFNIFAESGLIDKSLLLEVI
jgi:hypothetical protein